jgi:hypothetical protein
VILTVDTQLELLEMRTEVVMAARASSLTSIAKDDQLPGLRRDLRTWARLFNSTYRKRTFIGIMMMVFQRTPTAVSYLFPILKMNTHTEWSGINALLYYGPTLLLAVGLKGDTVTLLVAGGVGIVQTLAVFPVILLIDRLGETATCMCPHSLLTFLPA